MQMKRLPTTPGILWTLKGQTFKKAVMADQTSLCAVQWLYYLQATAPYLQQTNGARSIIQHAYHQGETRIGWDKVDGFADVDGRKFIFEMLGCYFHGCKCQINPNLDAREKWLVKQSRLKRAGNVISVWECDWHRMMAIDPTISSTSTHFPHILKDHEEDETMLIDYIKNGSFYGFVNCDLW